MTQHHHTPPPEPMPLDPEERALAARLARLGPHGEPSPALDARVLAAAHAATAGGTHAATGRRRGERDRGWRRARWPVGAGAAASVVLAAMIAWQMRPLPAPVSPSSESAVAVSAAPASAPASAPLQAVTGIERAADVASPSVARKTVVEAPRAGALSRPAPETGTTAAKAMAPPTESAPVVFDEPAPAEAAVVPPAPPAPPAARAQPMQQAAAAAAASGIAADTPEGDVPPATAASPEVREAWLARIRELAAAGHTDEARASLAEFHRRHPAFAIPEDLRPLLPPPSPPPPR